MARRRSGAHEFVIETSGPASARRPSRRIAARAAACAGAAAALLCLAAPFGVAAPAEKPAAAAQPPAAQAQPQPQPVPQKAAPAARPASADKQQMRGLDEQIQEVKSDVLKIAAELSQLEEKLLYPSGTQVAVFVALAQGDTMRLDAVRLSIDGQSAAQYVYSAKELEALRKGGVQRIYVGNVTTGDHQLEVTVEGKRDGGADFSRTERFAFTKDVKPKMVGLTFGGQGSGNPPIALGNW